MKKFLILLNFLWISVPQASPQTHTNPPAIAAYFAQEPARGSEIFTTFFMKIYEITLWSKKLPWDFNQVSAIQLKYKRDISKEKLMHYSMKSMGYVVDDKALLPVYEKILGKYVNDVKENDTFTFVYLPEKGIEFYVNDKKLDLCTNIEFAQTFMNIWLSPKTEYPNVRKTLLNGA